MIDSGAPVCSTIQSRAATTSRPPNPPEPQLYQRREATKLIDHGEHAKGPAIEAHAGHRANPVATGATLLEFEVVLDVAANDKTG